MMTSSGALPPFLLIPSAWCAPETRCTLVISSARYFLLAPVPPRVVLKIKASL